jgi:hypothetical protein
MGSLEGDVIVLGQTLRLLQPQLPLRVLRRVRSDARRNLGADLLLSLARVGLVDDVLARINVLELLRLVGFGGGRILESL